MSASGLADSRAIFRYGMLSRVNANIGLLLLLPMFFVQVIVAHQEYPFYSFALTIGLSMLLVVARGRINRRLLLWGILFAAVSTSLEIKSASQLFLAIKFLLLLSPALFLPTLLTRKQFDESLLLASKIALIGDVAIFAVGVVTGTGLGADNGYGVDRMQGFASEPSALALPISILLMRSIVDRNWRFLMVAVLAAILSQSLMVVVVSSLVMGVYFFFHANWLVKVGLTIAVAAIVTYGLDLVTYLGEAGADIPNVSRMSAGLIYLFTGGEDGYNPRLSYGYFFQDNVSVFGHGLNSYSGDDLRDWNLHLETIYAFGLVGWGIFLTWSAVTGLYLFRADRVAFLQYLCVYTYVSTNSAQGVVLSVIVFSYFMYVLKAIGAGRLGRRSERVASRVAS